MLSLGFSSVPYSYLSALVTSTDTTLIESGLSLQLAANSVYDFRATVYSWANGDGTKLRVSYTGGLVKDLFFTRTSAGSSEMYAVGDTITNLGVDQIFWFNGLLHTKSAGRLYIEFAKNTDTTDDTPLAAGSFLLAVRVS